MFKLSGLQSRPNSAVYQTLFRLQLYESGYMMERAKKHGDDLQKLLEPVWGSTGRTMEPGAFEDQKTVRSIFNAGPPSRMS
jgi:hypothetical protein